MMFVARKLSLFVLIFFCFGVGCSWGEEKENFVEITDRNNAFYAGYFQVVGRGEGDSKEMALLAARSVAQARLIGIINGLQVERNTHVKNGKVDMDMIHLKTQGVIKFASVCGEKYDSKSGLAEVCLKIGLKSGGFGDLVDEMIDDVE